MANSNKDKSELIHDNFIADNFKFYIFYFIISCISFLTNDANIA